MNAILLKDLKPKTYFTKNLFLDGGFVLLAPETALGEELINRLAKWEFRELKSEGQPTDAMLSEEERDGTEAEAKAPPVPDGERERFEAVLARYAAFTDYVEGLFTRFVTANELEFRELQDKVRELCELVSQQRRYVLKALSLASQHKNYLVSHAARSSILSIVLGTALKLPNFRLIELGAAAVLHEIGMIRLPPQLYMAGRALSALERKSLTAHPILGYNLLKEKQIPLAVCLAALEHHERMNGSGYPRALSGDKISLYSRIIMVACSYDAVTSSRPYKEAKDGYAGMVDILKNEGKQYDETIIKALVLSLSIYPIGTYVLLTSGKRGVVVDVIPGSPRYPLVQLLGVASPDGKDLVLKTSETGIRILRPLIKEEITSLQVST